MQDLRSFGCQITERHSMSMRMFGVGPEYDWFSQKQYEEVENIVNDLKRSTWLV